MQLDKIILNTVFDYKKDIRRYTYDIESELKKLFGEQSVKNAFVPPFPDEIEPEMPRASFIIEQEKYNIQMDLSQLRLSISYAPTHGYADEIEKYFDIFVDITNKIKEFLSTQIRDFNIFYEGFILSRKNESSSLSEMELFKSIDANVEEKREKNCDIKENKYFITVERVFFKAYNQTSAFNPLNINNGTSFAFYVEMIIVEFNNRNAYNIQPDIKNNVLNIDDKIKKLLCESK